MFDFLTKVSGQRSQLPALTLSEEDVMAYWGTYSSTLYGQIMAEMDELDIWSKRVFGDSLVTARLSDVLRDLSDSSVSDESIRDQAPNIVLICAYLPTSKCVYLLNWLEMHRPAASAGVTRYILSSIESSAIDPDTKRFTPAGMVAHRLAEIKRLITASHVFSHTRTKAVGDACSDFEKTKFEEAGADDMGASSVALGSVM